MSVLLVLPLRDRKLAARLSVAAGIFLVAAGAYLAWRASYFGGLLPTSFHSKAGGGGALADAWRVNRDKYFTTGVMPDVPFGPYYVVLLLLAAGGLFFRPAERDARRLEFVTFVTALVYSLVYPNFVDWMPGMRYHAALIPLFVLGAAHLLSPLFRSAPNPARLAVLAVVGLAAVGLNLREASILKGEATRQELRMQRALIPLARWLGRALPNGTLLATADVGAVPYYSRLPTLDIHPESLTDRHIATHGFSVDYVFERDPGVVLLGSSGTTSNFRREHQPLLRDPRFRERYRFVGVSRLEALLQRSYWVFVARPIPLSDEHLADFPLGVGQGGVVARPAGG